MSDTRFIISGIALIFVGFIVLGIFGGQYFEYTVQQLQFEECYEYFEDMPPRKIDCDVKLQDKMLFFVLVIALLVVGVIALIKGIRGKWDQEVKPGDMVGPGGGNTVDSDKKSNGNQ